MLCQVCGGVAACYVKSVKRNFRHNQGFYNSNNKYSWKESDLPMEVCVCAVCGVCVCVCCVCSVCVWVCVYVLCVYVCAVCVCVCCAECNDK